MDDHDGPGLCRDGACNRRNVDIAGIRLGIDEDRLRAGQFDRVRAGDVGLRRHDHFIAGPQPKREPDEMHAGRARRNRHRLRRAGERGEFVFERRRARAMNKDRTGEHVHDGRALLFLDNGLAERKIALGRGYFCHDCVR